MRTEASLALDAIARFGMETGKRCPECRTRLGVLREAVAERDRYKAALERIRTHDVRTDTDRYEACFDAIQQVADDALKGADAEANSPHSRAV